MGKKAWRWMSVGIGIALLTGCSEVPYQELNSARAAIEDAKEVGAEAYAPSQLQAAQMSLELAMKELSVENRKLPFFRKYDKAIKTLNSTASAAKSAEKAVEKAKKRIATEAEDLLELTKGMADDIDTLLAGADKRQLPTGTLPADLDTIRISAMKSSTALGAGDLFTAKEKAMEAHSKALQVKAAADSLIPPPKKIRSRRR
ncbi:MAG: DUF4398 domain-containing protein [Chitinispirillaceae bacterium]|nr:DUF4398 domain-containing protein [Chitinispirillaceae bacterium]